MCNDKEYNGEFFDANYFEKGRETGKSWYENYHWMPQRSLREAFAYIDYLNLNGNDYILDIGTAKGFLVKAFRILNIRADGCDISDYALSFAPTGCWNCSDDKSWDEHANCGYTHILIKDVLEHMSQKRLEKSLDNYRKVAKKMMCIVPMGDNGVYRIPEYHLDISHIIIENEIWWAGEFKKHGWEIIKDTNHIPGLKDNWSYAANGNHIYLLERE